MPLRACGDGEVDQPLPDTAQREHRARSGLRALFSPDESGIQLKSAPSYVTPVRRRISRLCSRRLGVAAIGYRVQSAVREAPNFGLRLNPDQAAELTLATDDRVIVLAEN